MSVSVYMHVCMHVRMFVCMCACIYEYVYMYVCTYVSMLYVCMYEYTSNFLECPSVCIINIKICICCLVYYVGHLGIQACMYVYMYVNMYACMCVRM